MIVVGRCIKTNFIHFSVVLVLLFSFVGCHIQPISIGKLEKARLVSFSAKEAEIELAVKINNPNFMGFTLYRSDIQLTVEGINLSTVQLEDRVRVIRKSDKLHVFKIKADLSKLSFTDLPKALTIAQKRSANIALSGTLKAGNFFYRKKFPIDYKDRVDIQR